MLSLLIVQTSTHVFIQGDQHMISTVLVSFNERFLPFNQML